MKHVTVPRNGYEGEHIWERSRLTWTLGVRRREREHREHLGTKKTCRQDGWVI